jgi:hypothetical protein
MAGNALLLAEETTKGTFVTPSGAHSGLANFSVVTGETRIDRYEQGRSPGLVAQEQGTHLPTATAETFLEPDNNLALLLAAMNMPVAASAQVDTSDAYDHAFLLDWSAAPASFSLQAQLGLYSTVTALNGRGFEVGSLAIAAAVDDQVRATIEMMGQEVTKAGTAFGNGNTSPAAQAISFSALAKAFQFDDVAVSVGGTVSFSSSLYSVSGGSAVAGLESVNLTIALNKEQRPTLGSRYSTLITPGDLDITGQLVIHNDPPTTAWFDKMIANTQEALVITMTGTEIESGYNNALEITLPVVAYQETDAFGAIEGQRTARTITIPFRAVSDEANGHHIGIRLRNDTASYS